MKSLCTGQGIVWSGEGREVSSQAGGIQPRVIKWWCRLEMEGACDFSRMTLVQRVTHFCCCFSSCTEFRILCQKQEEVGRSKMTSSGKGSPVHTSMSYMEMLFSLERRNSCPSATRVSDDHMSSTYLRKDYNCVLKTRSHS